MIEIWRKLKYPGVAQGYLISSVGRIKAESITDDYCAIPTYRSSNGYDYIRLLVSNDVCSSFCTRHFPIDDLIASAFIEPTNDLFGKYVKVNHKNGNTRDSSIENLEWIEDIEEWKDIKNFEDIYQISNHGRVRNSATGDIKSCFIQNLGYQQISLWKNSKSTKKYIHRLYMETFHPILNMDKYDVNHIDEIKAHNYEKNLEWVQHNENMRFGNISKQVMCIETNVIYGSVRHAATELNCSHWKITYCCKNPEHTINGLHLRYL